MVSGNMTSGEMTFCRLDQLPTQCLGEHFFFSKGGGEVIRDDKIQDAKFVMSYC